VVLCQNFAKRESKCLGETDPQRNFFDFYVEECVLVQEHEPLEIKENVDFFLISQFW